MDPGPISFILLSPVYFTRTVYFLAYYYCFPLDRLIPLFTANREIDNLIVSWEQSIWLCCVQVPHCSWQSKALDEAPYKLSGAVAKLASITFWSLAFSWIRQTLVSSEGKLVALLIIPSSWGSQLDGDLHQHRTTTSNKVFWCRCRGKRRLLQGEFHTHILYFVLSFALLYFYLFHFIKNTKKLVSFIVVTLLILVHYVVP
jgi:hypothetical protein